MNNSTFIVTAEINDPRFPGEKIILDIHEIEGGTLGIDPSYSEEIANYILNPYEECSFVKLSDSMDSDDILDPPIKEDEIYCFLKMLSSLDEIFSQLKEEDKNNILDILSKKTGFSRDKIDFHFGLSKNSLEAIALEEAKKALRSIKDIE